MLAGPQPSASEQATVINQNAELYVAELARGERISRGLTPGRQAWIQVVRGNVSLNGKDLQEGDGAGVSDERELNFTGSGATGGEFLVFDLP